MMLSTKNLGSRPAPKKTKSKFDQATKENWTPSNTDYLTLAPDKPTRLLASCHQKTETTAEKEAGREAQAFKGSL